MKYISLCGMNVYIIQVSLIPFKKCMCIYIYTYIYIYAFSRCFYPKRLTIAFRLYIFVSMCVPWESNPQPFALLTQCSTTEPHRNTYTYIYSVGESYFYIYFYICTHTYIYTHTHIFIYTHTYIYIHTHLPDTLLGTPV